MRIATIKLNRAEVTSVLTGVGFVPVDKINEKLAMNWPTDMQELILSGRLAELNSWYRADGRTQLAGLAAHAVPKDKAHYAPLFRHPSKIWGIGLNYVDNAGDLSEKAPTLAPASFAMLDTTIIDLKVHK
jgi:hypothetical protein